MSNALAITRIPPELAGELLTRSAAGESAATLCAWLQETHGIEVVPRAVQRHLRRLRRLFGARGGERAIEASAQAHELVDVEEDLDQLDALRRRATEYERKAIAAGDVPTALAAMRVQLAALAVAIRAGTEDELRYRVDGLERELDESESEWPGG